MYGDTTYAGNLTFYRGEIPGIVALPGPGAVNCAAARASFLVLLGRRRIRP